MAAVMVPPPAQPQRHTGVFSMPDSTPAPNAYPNLVGAQGNTGGTVKFSERKFRRTESSEENQAVCLQMLRDTWGYTKFREHQLDICMSAVRDRDIMMVAPTGLGKSLCFQLPALVLEYGLTIIVTPIKALMHDQILDLAARGIDAMLACGDTTDAEYAAIKKQFQMGHPRKRIMYITPESLIGPTSKWMPIIRVANRNGQLRRLVIDEAHCITEWGTTFRDSYRSLGEFRKEFPRVPISAFTASANKWTRSEIATTLGMDKTNFDMWVLPVNRSNIYYEVAYRSSGPECAPTDAFIALWILRHIEDLRERNHENDIFTNTVTGIVYCRRIDQCEEMTRTLCKHGIRAATFNARMTTSDKASVLKRWKEGKLDCVCATIAFGMGIDQAHVRYVVHYNLPKSFEGFYQETGRAGRDGHVSRSLLVYSREDANQVFNDISREYSALEKKRDAALGKKLEAVNQAARAEAEAEVADLEIRLKGVLRQFKSLEKLRDDLVENVGQCRHLAICRYFGETIPDDVDRRTYCDGMCDVCTNKAAVLRRFNLINPDIELPSQVPEAEVDTTIAFEDQDPPSESEPETDSQSLGVNGTLALIRGSGSYHSSSPHAAASTSTSTLSSTPGRGRIRTGGTPSASLLSLANAVHRPGGLRTMGLGRRQAGRRQLHGRSRLGLSSPVRPGSTEADSEGADAGPAPSLDDDDADAGVRAGASPSAGAMSLSGGIGEDGDDGHLGPTQLHPFGTAGIHLLSDPPEHAAVDGSSSRIAVTASTSQVSSSPHLPARAQMRAHAHTQARRRVGLGAYSSTDNLGASSDVSAAEPPNLALPSRTMGKAKAGAGDEMELDMATGMGMQWGMDRDRKGKGKRLQRDRGDGSDPEEDEEDEGPPRKKGSARKLAAPGGSNGQRSRARGGRRQSRAGPSKIANGGDGENRDIDAQHASAPHRLCYPLRQPLADAGHRTNRKTNATASALGDVGGTTTRRRAIGMSSLLDETHLSDLKDKSSSPRPIPSVIQPYSVPPTALAAAIGRKGHTTGKSKDDDDGTTKNKGKGKAKVGAAPIASAKAGPSARSARGASAFTLDSIAGPSDGSYALPAPPEETDVARWKRKKQIEAFEGVETVSGEGPFGYYNSTAPAAAAPRTPRTPAHRVRGRGHAASASYSASAAGRASMNSAIQSPMSVGPRRAATQGFKTPFKTPFRRAEEKGRMGPILADTRKETLGKIQEGLLKHQSCAVWSYWGIEEEGRGKGIKKVARSLEHELALSQYTSTDYTAAIQVLLRCLKLLGVADVVRAICNNELAGDFGKGETGAMMRLVERFAKEHGGI